jgi:hypothetical protein
MTMETNLSISYGGFGPPLKRGPDWVGEIADTRCEPELRSNPAEVPAIDVELDEFRGRVSAAKFLFAEVMEELAG